MSKEFREYIATWIETGFEWYNENPEWITKYRFGHDFNNDCCFKFLYKHGTSEPDYTFRQAHNILGELIPMLIVHKEQMDSSTAVLLDWLRREGLSHPLSIQDFFVKQFAYSVYHLLKGL